MSVWIFVVLLLTKTIATHAQEYTPDQIFDDVDTDDDGGIEVEEIEEFIREEVGGEAFDTDTEVEREAQTVFRTVFNKTQGKKLTAADLVSFWKSLGSLLTTAEVTDWIHYGLQLPQLATAFRSHAVTGYDFPTLCKNEGALLKSLGIDNALHRHQILRGMKMILLGIGGAPAKPTIDATSSTCHSISLGWRDENLVSRIPITQYRLQRRLVASADSKLPVDPWTTIWSGHEDFYRDSCLQPGQIFEYRVDAWNTVGHSAFSTVVRVSTTTDSCGPLEKSCLEPSQTHAEESASSFIETIIALSITLFGIYFASKCYRIDPTAEIHRPDMSILPNLHAIDHPLSPIGSGPAISPDVASPASPLPLPEAGVCFYCRKRLGFKKEDIGWRTKHICSLCKVNFCGKCGQTNHTRFRSCGSSCKCQVCAKPK